MQPHSKHFCAK